jgi:hypothetical protein
LNIILNHALYILEKNNLQSRDIFGRKESADGKKGGEKWNG